MMHMKIIIYDMTFYWEVQENATEHRMMHMKPQKLIWNM